MVVWVVWVGSNLDSIWSTFARADQRRGALGVQATPVRIVEYPVDVPA